MLVSIQRRQADKKTPSATNILQPKRLTGKVVLSEGCETGPMKEEGRKDFNDGV